MTWSLQVDDGWPNDLAEIAEVIGPEAALKFARVFGGAEVYVPQKMTEHHPIAIALGHEDAARLAREFGGQRFKDLPNASLLTKRIIQGQVIAALEAGEISKQEAARQLGVAVRYLRRRVKALAGRQVRARDDRQLDMMDFIDRRRA